MAPPPAYDPDGFNAYERSGWGTVSVTAAYSAGFGDLTTQAIGPLLDAVRAGPGVRMLDVACGPGWVAAAAAQRGATPIGVDISVAMLAAASRSYPRLDFRPGDAESLPWPDGEFDAVVMNFGLRHLGRPERAVAEAYRVLRSGGRFGFTDWTDPGRAIGFGLVLRSIEAHGTLDVDLPAGPSFSRFSDPAECTGILLNAGFVTPRTVAVPQVWRLDAPERLFEVMYDSAVRTRALLLAQTSEVLAAIRAATTEGARAYAKEGIIELPMPALLASGMKP